MFFVPVHLHRLTIEQRIYTSSSLLVVRRVHLPSELGPVFRSNDGDGQVDDHCPKYDQAEVEVQVNAEGSHSHKDIHHNRKNLQDLDVDQRWEEYLEEGSIEDGGDGAGAPVHHPEHLPRLPRVVPSHLDHIAFVASHLHKHCII